MTEPFKTADMALAAYLILEGFRHSAVELVHGSGRQAEFVFEDGADIRGAIDEYELGHGSVEPRDFTRKLAFVRNRMKDCVRDGSSVA